MIEITDR